MVGLKEVSLALSHNDRRLGWHKWASYPQLAEPGLGCDPWAKLGHHLLLYMDFHWNTAMVIHLHITAFELQKWTVYGPQTENVQGLTNPGLKWRPVLETCPGKCLLSDAQAGWEQCCQPPHTHYAYLAHLHSIGNMAKTWALTTGDQPEPLWCTCVNMGIESLVNPAPWSYFMQTHFMQQEDSFTK